MTLPFAHWVTRRLSTRIVALFLGLLLLVQAAGFGAIGHSIERNARAQLAHELQLGERVWRRLLAQNAQTLLQGATLLAADFGFRTAVSSGDVETLRSALGNHGARIGATLSALLDTGLEVRAVSDAAGSGTAALLQRLATPLTRSEQGSLVALVGNRPYQFVVVPMKAPVVIGWVVMGFPIDRALLDDMRTLSDLHVALMAPGSGAPALVLSTLAPDGARALEASAAGAGEVTLQGEAMVMRVVPLTEGAQGASVVLLRSVDEASAPYRQLQWLLALITGLGVLLFGIGSIVTARHVTTPLRSLVTASEKLGRGHYDETLQHTERPDEIGDLARAFDQMRTDVAVQRSEIHDLAYRDRLTGLPNRLSFRDAAHEAISQCTDPDAGVAVIMLDLDRFKHVNDVLGYAFGDQLLKAVAGRLTQHTMRGRDLVARLGGDEFAILLRNGDAEHATAIAARIARSFEAPLMLEDQTVDLSAGIGIACWPAHAANADALLSRAEVAMYAAKRRTEAAVVYDPAIDSASTQTLSLLSELRRALELGELRLYLQPKIELNDARLVGAEALLRWQHPARGMVPPMDFIPFAEQTGFVRQLTLWIFDEAARHWSALQRHGGLRISVNLSTRDLLDKELPDKLNGILQRHGVPAQGFCLEITESAIMDDPQRAEATLSRLSERGFKLSIDDFGTGYSSLAYLKRLPVHELKIDKSFVMAMERDDDDAKIVRSTIDLAHNLGLSVVAEGVENVSTWQQLRDLDCDEAQGYHMSRPLAADDFDIWVARWNERRALAPTATAFGALH
jgi:diguanylate cyclase (GGDEF)-like protein